ncbi:MAG: CCA tRNA nucleotidyltransferase, partial [Pseudomonadota bacterium]
MTADDRPLRIAPLWAADPGMRAIMAALTAEGAEARFVGGCVRNALLGPEAPAETDIDVAINRPPPETIRLLEQAGLKAIPTGVEHGTVTAATPDVDKSEESPGERRVAAVEVTSLRRDVETDGRRAVVAFTEDWAEDAGRRDFTMNALYADADGVVHDPLGQGRSDLAARRVRFIGAAEQRIREDYLRSLRYFRFYAWYGAAGGLDPEDLSAVTRLASGIDGLARERIGAEMLKLLAAPDPAPVIAAMAAPGILARCLPGATSEN